MGKQCKMPKEEEKNDISLGEGNPQKRKKFFLKSMKGANVMKEREIFFFSDDFLLLLWWSSSSSLMISFFSDEISSEKKNISGQQIAKHKEKGSSRMQEFQHKNLQGALWSDAQIDSVILDCPKCCPLCPVIIEIAALTCTLSTKIRIKNIYRYYYCSQ